MQVGSPHVWLRQPDTPATLTMPLLHNTAGHQALTLALAPHLGVQVPQLLLCTQA